METTLTYEQAREVVRRWVFAQRDSLQPEYQTLSGLMNPKTKKQRESEHLVAVALREVVQTLFSHDPYFLVEKMLGFPNGGAPQDEVVSFLVSREASRLVTEELLTNQPTKENNQ